MKGLRRPIKTNLNGQPVTFLTVGHLARAVHRTTWSVRHWQRLGLLPRPPFAIHRDDDQRRRWLYPADFVRRVAEVVAQYEIGERLNREDWGWFRDEVFAAFRDTMDSLRGDTTSPEPDRASA